MTFDKILENNTLWAVRYDGVADNALKTLFDQWSDPEWLVDLWISCQNYHKERREYEKENT